MLPQRSGSLGKDWMQILIGLVWFTVVLIMLLSKMKAVQDLLLLAFLLGATAVQNSETFLPWAVSVTIYRRSSSGEAEKLVSLRSSGAGGGEPKLPANEEAAEVKLKKFRRNLIAVQKHVQYECLYAFLLSWALLEVVHVCGTNFGTASWLYFGWLFQLISSLIYMRHPTWLLNPVITAALRHGTKGLKTVVISDVQMGLYVLFQVTGMTLGLLLHCVRTSGTDYLSLFHTLEPDYVSMAEGVVACGASYVLARIQVKLKLERDERRRLEGIPLTAKSD